MGEYCRKKQGEYEDRGMHCRRTCVPDSLLRRVIVDADGPDAKRRKPTDPNIYTRNIAYFRAHYTNENMPKVILHSYAQKNDINNPTYETIQEDRLFQAIVTFQGKQYASSYWEKNKRFAEQGAALACSLGIGLVTEVDLIKNGSLTK